MKIQKFYHSRLQKLIFYATKHLSELAEWTVPDAGMFVWLKLHGVDDSEVLLDKLAEEKVAVVPGKYFMPSALDTEEESSECYCPYFRVAFTVATDDKMDEGLSRLAKLLKNYAKKA